MGESLYIDIAREGCEKIIGFDIGVQLVLINDAIIQGFTIYRIHPPISR